MTRGPRRHDIGLRAHRLDRRRDYRDPLCARRSRTALVGVDTTSLYPPEALRDKPNVGYMRQLSAEGVLGLNPSLVLAMQGSGPKETMDLLEAAKVPLVMVPETFSEARPDREDQAGRPRHGRRARGRMPATTVVTGDLARLRELRAKVTKPVRVMFVMSLPERPGDGRGPEDRRQRNHRSSPAASTRSTATTATRSSATRRSSRPSPTSCCRSQRGKDPLQARRGVRPSRPSR